MPQKPNQIIFYPMLDGQGWYIQGVYANGQRLTFAEFWSEVGLDLARSFAQRLAEKFGLARFDEAELTTS